MSYLRKRVFGGNNWIPACAGMTKKKARMTTYTIGCYEKKELL